jgi:hypothetical protein
MDAVESHPYADFFANIGGHGVHLATIIDSLPECGYGQSQELSIRKGCISPSSLVSSIWQLDRASLAKEC